MVPAAKSICKAQGRDWQKVKAGNKERRIERDKKYILDVRIRRIEAHQAEEISRVKAELGIR